MAAEKVVFIRGIRVELWKTCFKIEGMSDVVYSQHSNNLELISQLIDAVYENLFDRCKEAAARKLSNNIYHLVK